MEQQDAASFEAINWGEGERPEWWRDTHWLWRYTLASGRSSLALDLDEVLVDVLAYLRGTREPDYEATRRALFLAAPLDGIPESIPELGLHLQRVDPNEVLRRELAFSSKLAVYQRDQEANLHRMVVTLGQEDALRAIKLHGGENRDAARTLFSQSGNPRFRTFFGLSPRELVELSKSTRAYALTALCFLAIEEEEELKAAARAAERAAKEERAMARLARAQEHQDREDLARWVGYLEMGVTPKSQAQEEAMALHEAVARAATDEEQAALIAERDAALMEAIEAEREARALSLSRLMASHDENLAVPDD